VMATLTGGRAEVVSSSGADGGGAGSAPPRLDRMFKLVCVRPWRPGRPGLADTSGQDADGHGTGWGVTADADVDVEVLYSGEEMQVPCDVDDYTDATEAAGLDISVRSDASSTVLAPEMRAPW